MLDSRPEPKFADCFKCAETLLDISACTPIENCHYPYCTKPDDSVCKYCHGEVKDQYGWHAYTRLFPGDDARKCRRKYTDHYFRRFAEEPVLGDQAMLKQACLATKY